MSVAAKMRSGDRTEILEIIMHLMSYRVMIVFVFSPRFLHALLPQFSFHIRSGVSDLVGADNAVDTVGSRVERLFPVIVRFGHFSSVLSLSFVPSSSHASSPQVDHALWAVAKSCTAHGPSRLKTVEDVVLMSKECRSYHTPL